MLLIPDRMVFVSGQTTTREGERAKIRATRLLDIKDAWGQPHLAVQLLLPGNALEGDLTKQVFTLLQKNQGSTPVVMSLALADEEVTIRAKRYPVRVTDGLLGDLERLLGPGKVQIKRNGTID